MLLAAIVFFVVFLVALLCVGLGLAFLQTRQRNQVRQMLHTAEASTGFDGAILVRPAEEDDGFKRFLSRYPLFGRLQLLLEQSGSGWTVERFLMFSLAGAAAAGIAAWKINLFAARAGAVPLCAAIGAIVPLMIVLRKRGKTFDAFEKQFPEALDFMGRSMRAGHGFSITLEMLSNDAPEPLASSLKRVCHEMQLGSPLEVALGKMADMVPLVDVRFFVSTVLLQQESGGNLSEILSKLSYVIRERFRLKGQVKALSAHGRITGLVLLLMPVGVTAILLATSPDYLNTLTSDKDGRLMIYGAVAGQILAYFIIKKIVNIKV